MKISFDYDDTLTKLKNQIAAQKLILDGNEVYIISARQYKPPMMDIANKLGIPSSRVFATGSNKNKVSKVLELGIKVHYDNNLRVVKALEEIGKLV